MSQVTTTDDPCVANILVLYDNGRLFDIIKANLGREFFQVTGIDGQWIASHVEPSPKADNSDLIIIAISASSGEPLVLMSNARLIDQVGHIPVLIVSDREFESDSDSQIFHLDFPFDAAELRQQVQSIICESSKGVLP